MVHKIGIFWTLTLLVVTQEQVQGLNYFHYDDCTKQSNEGNVYINKNSTWLECKNGVLERYCIAERIDGRLDCVPHVHVKALLDYVGNDPTMTAAMRPYYAAKTNQKYVRCSKMQDERLDILQREEHKMDCLQGRQKVDTRTAENIFCTMTENKVYYVDYYDWYKCKNGAFHLERCVKKINDKHHCLSTQKINQALEASAKQATFNNRRGTFCSEFFRRPTYYMPNYMDEMQVCSDYNDDIAPVPQPEVNSDEYFEAVTEAPYVPPKSQPRIIPIVTPPAPTRRHFVKRYPRRRRTRITTPAPTTRDPYVPVECRIVSWGKCFDPRDAARQMMSRPILEAFNRPDKLVSWGDMTLKQTFEVLEAGRQSAMSDDQSGMTLIEAVEKATGLHKCEVITQKLPLNDAIYYSVAKACTCSDDLPCY